MAGSSQRRKKQGKERQDRFYHLAKEQGYRARSAFKLIQLAQRFSLFKRPPCTGTAGGREGAVVDLCAAPGGWLQVTAKHVPVATRIVGVDLVPIRKIRGVDTLTEDITKPSLPARLKKLLDGADVYLVLHDGAPNMGTDWSIDAFQQNVLVLSALRVAAKLLCPGGTFVSKVFRSQDYASLLFVLHALFSRVHATKPQASRNVSAEIFVVCQGFRKATVIDPRFFDPKAVFLCESSLTAENPSPCVCAAGQQAASPACTEKKVVAATASTGAIVASLADEKKSIGPTDDSTASCGGGIYGKGKKGLFAELLRQQARRHRDGDWLATLRSVSVEEFLATAEPVPLLLQQARDIFFQQPATPLEEVVRTHANTTEEILRCMKDVQVLGKGELHALLRWRFRIKKALKQLGTSGDKQLNAVPAATAAAAVAGDDKDGETREGGTAEKEEVGESDGEGDGKEEAEKKEERVCEELDRQRVQLQRRIEKQQKRIQRKQHQQQLRMRLSKGFLEADGSGAGHHRDPDLFVLAEKTGALLEEERSCMPVTSDPLCCNSDSDDESRSTAAAGTSDSESVIDAVEESSDELDRIDYLEADLTVSHRLKKLEAAAAPYITTATERVATTGKVEQLLRKKTKQKRTRREQVRSQWATELEEFRDSMQQQAARLHAEKSCAESEAEVDETEESDSGGEELVERGQTTPSLREGRGVRTPLFQEDGKGAVDNSAEKNAKKNRRGKEKVADGGNSDSSSSSSCRSGKVREEQRGGTCKRGTDSRATTEILDDGEDEALDAFLSSAAAFTEKPLPATTGASELVCCYSSNNSESNNSSYVSGVKKKRGEKKRGEGAGGDEAISQAADTERTARWFRQPIFAEDSEEDFNPVLSAERLLSLGAAVSAAEKKKPKKQLQLRSSASAAAAAEESGDEDLVNSGATEANTATIAAPPRDSMRELDEAVLPEIPACERKLQQQRRRERAQREREKQERVTQQLDFMGGVVDEGKLVPKKGKKRLAKSLSEIEEVPPLEEPSTAAAADTSSALIRPTDPHAVAEIQAIGSLLIKKSSRMDLLDNAYNRYAFNDEALPEWFEEEENKHNKPELPVTKELMRAYRQKLLDISSRPIRKVQEARARKKLRERRRLQRVKSHAAAIAESAEFTEAGKAKAIEKLVKKARYAEEKREKAYYVVTRRSGGGKMAQRKAGKNRKTKNKNCQVKCVDRRLKKDKRAQRLAAARGRGKRGPGGRSKSMKRGARYVRQKTGKASRRGV